MKALLSIKPEYVEKIISGEKLFEYRKSIFKKPGIKFVVIYSTMPEGKIVGEFKIGEILERHPSHLWDETKHCSGIKKSFFDEYFLDRDKAYAIQICDFKKYPEPIDPYKIVPTFKAPQSFMYINSDSGLCIK